MMYQKYLVTGAKDPVGRLVVQMLLAEGCKVRVLVPPESDSSLLKGMGAEISEGEIIDKDSLKEFFTVEDPRSSAVIHTEEILSISNNKNMDMRRTNVAGAQNVIDVAMRSKIGRFVYLVPLMHLILIPLCQARRFISTGPRLTETMPRLRQRLPLTS